jgi:hypothetical protein
MKPWIKNILYIIIIPLLMGMFFFDNIRGYYRFKQLCAIEKNKQLINKVEPNQGWILNDGVPSSKWDAFRVASLPYVKYVRYLDYKDKQLYDVRYFGDKEPAKNPITKNSSYEEFYDMKLAHPNEKPVYAWKEIQEKFPNELRTSRYGDQVIDLRTNNVVINLTNIGYGLFDRNHTLLDAPSGNTCEWYEYLGKESNKALIFGK